MAALMLLGLMLMGGAAVALVEAAEPPMTFCVATGRLGGGLVIDGRDSVLQDAGDPGPDACDAASRHPHMLTVGLDCEVRDPSGQRVGSMPPNRTDGTCGLAGDDPANHELAAASFVPA